MQIIIHRVNKIEQLEQIPRHYGVEIDVRGYGQRLVLNHEPLQPGDDFEEYLDHYRHSSAIFNIKEAGIERKVIELAKQKGIENYFLLDVEFPYMYYATRRDKVRNIAVRYSEAEPIEMALAQKGLLDWVWIDTNTVLPVTPELMKQLEGFKTCLVCPERWGRPQDIPIYKRYMQEKGIKLDAVMTALKHAKEWES